MKINKKALLLGTMAFVLVAASGMVSAYASGSSGTKKAKVQTITEGVCIGSVDVGGMTKEEAKKAMEIMLSGEATQAQIAAFLTAMRMKGETLEELIGLASVLRDKAETITPKFENYVDLVGTGGDCTGTDK